MFSGYRFPDSDPLEEDPKSKSHRSGYLVQERLLVAYVAPVWLRSYSSHNPVQQRTIGQTVGVCHLT